MKKNLTLIGVLVIALAVFFAFYSGQAAALETDRVLVITPETATIDIGGSQQYRAYVSTDGGATLGAEVTDQCSWSVDDPDVAALGAAGHFTGSTAGETTVRAVFVSQSLVAAFPTLYGDAQLIVREPVQPRNWLEVEPKSATIEVDDSQQYRAYLYSSAEADPTDVTDLADWDIDEDIATMTAPGKYKGDREGTSFLTASYKGLIDDAKLAVLQREELVKYWLVVEPKTATVEVGDSQQYRAYLYSSDAADPTDVTSDADWVIVEDIATMTSKGKYKGVREGTSFLSATYEEMSDDAKLTVWKREEVEKTPPTKDLPEGKMLDRQPGYITLCEPQDLGNPGAEFTITYDNSLMDGNPDRYPKVFYWNKSYEKWVALASYPQTPGVVKAVNDGNYSGWFVVFGCIQPRWNDITADWKWAEPVANRMNGLGLLEGYPDPANPTALVRPAGINRTITRAELTAFVARILGLAPGDTHLYPTITYLSDMENNAILRAKYSDADEIPAWARPYVAAMTSAGLVNGKGDRFAPNDKMTRIEAAVLISNALRDVPGFGHPADLSIYTDADLIPAWAVGQVAEGTIGGYPDGSLRPNQPINRAESMVLLLKLLRGLGW